MFGLGLRHPHHQHILQKNPDVDFFEVHTENFIAEGGASLDFLEKISAVYPLSFHCVGMSLGSACGLDKKHLRKIKKLLDCFKPILFSDHLSWSNSKKSGTANDLLPIPYTKEALQIFCDNVNQAQDFFGHEILIENPSAYLEFSDSKISEVNFLNQISHRTKCGILLDINNVFVSAENFSFDAKKYLGEIDVTKVKEIHLAGHSILQTAPNLIQNPELMTRPFDQKSQRKTKATSENTMLFSKRVLDEKSKSENMNADLTGYMRIDTHSTHICEEVFDLYKNFVKKNGRQIPTLIEWDEEIPEFEVLFNEMKKVKSLT